MADLTQMELQYLRHFIGSCSTEQAKLTDYANKAVDPEVKQFFTKAMQDSLNTKQTLLAFLEE
jgi:hypothetical protein